MFPIKLSILIILPIILFTQTRKNIEKYLEFREIKQQTSTLISSDQQFVSRLHFYSFKIDINHNTYFAVFKCF